METSFRLAQYGRVGLASIFWPDLTVSATQTPQIPALAQLWDCFPVFAGKAPPSGADGAHEASYTDEGQGAADVIGHCRQTELAPDILDAACEEVPLPHPLLDRAKRMFNTLAALIHDFRVRGQPFRHPVQNSLIRIAWGSSQQRYVTHHRKVSHASVLKRVSLRKWRHYFLNEVWE